MEELFTEKKVRLRRRKILENSKGDREDKFKNAYNTCVNVYKNTNNTIIKLRAKSDAIYFKRFITKYFPKK